MSLVRFDQRLHKNSRKTGKMDDELPYLKLNLYLFSSADAEQGQDQRDLTVEEKKLGVREDVRPTHPVRWSEVKKARQRSARKQATSENRGQQKRDKQARRNVSDSMPKRVTKTPCQNQGGQNRAAKEAMILSQWRALPRESGISKEDPSKRTNGGEAERRRSPSPPVMQTPQVGQSDQSRWGDGKHPNQTNKQTNQTGWWEKPQ